MYATFNMGVGMVLAINREDSERALSLILIRGSLER